MATSGSRLPITSPRHRPPAWIAAAAGWVEARTRAAALVALGAILTVIMVSPLSALVVVIMGGCLAALMVMMERLGCQVPKMLGVP